MSRLSEFAVSKRSVMLLLAGALFIAGILAWGNLKQELLPDIEFPVITVIAPLPGAGAADVADQVTKPIERAISGVPNLKSLQSTSANSLALVVAQFAFGSDVKEIRAAIEANLQNAGLPQTVTPQVTALDINASPVIIASIAATSQDGLAAAADVTQNAIKPALLGIDGVGSVDVTGGEEQRIQITLDPEKLAANGVSLAQVTGVLAANNLTFPSGQITTEGSKIPVSTIGRIGSVDEITGMVVGVKMPTAAPARAPASRPPRARAPRPASARRPGASGQPAPSQAPASGQPGASQAPAASARPNASAAPAGAHPGHDRRPGHRRDPGRRHDGLRPHRRQARAVAVRLEDLQRQHRRGRRRGHRQAQRARRPAQGHRLGPGRQRPVRLHQGVPRRPAPRGRLTGALFAILTIFLFLFSLRSTLVAAVSIPLSILTALVIMQVTGVTLNIMTLGGLAVAVGRVVDDAIVVLENIYRHRALGEDRLTASINGPREVAGAITAATVTTVGVFLPLGFVGGLVSQFFLPFALTVTFALLASLVCALTVVPVLAYLLIKRGQGQRRRGRRAEELVLDQGVHADDHDRAAQPQDQARRGGHRHRAVPAHRRPRPAPAHGVHQRGLREDPAGHHRAARRRLVAGRPRPGRQGRADPPAGPQRPARPDLHPGRGRGGVPDGRRRDERPPREQRPHHRQARRQRGPHRPTRRPSPTTWRRSRPTATTWPSRRPPGSPPTAST